MSKKRKGDTLCDHIVARTKNEMNDRMRRRRRKKKAELKFTNNFPMVNDTPRD